MKVFMVHNFFCSTFERLNEVLDFFKFLMTAIESYSSLFLNAYSLGICIIQSDDHICPSVHLPGDSEIELC